MHIQYNMQLKPFNTLNLNATASHYVKVKNIQDVQDALAFAHTEQLNVLILSGGSNMLLPEHIHALVMHMDIHGIEKCAEDDASVTLKIGAGQVWHDFVLWSTEQ